MLEPGTIKNASMTRSGASSLASCSSTKVATFFSNLGPLLRINQCIGIETWQQVSKYQLFLHGFCAADSPSSEALTAGSVLSSWQWECPFHQCLPLPFLPLPFPLQKNIGQQLGSCESRAKRLQRKDFTLQSGMQCTSVLSLLKCIVPHCGSKGMLHTREWHSASREKGVES